MDHETKALVLVALTMLALIFLKIFLFEHGKMQSVGRFSPIGEHTSGNGVVTEH